VRLTLVAEVQPPAVDGYMVQANDIDILGQRAVVAYNFAGDTFKGAVQVIDFSDPDRPVMESEVLYRAADANAVALLGSHLYVGLASDDPALSSPALLSELELTGGAVAPTGDWLDLPSWAVTDLAVHGNDLVASVGADLGGFALLERNRLRLAAFASEPDARSVATDGGTTILGVCGTEPWISTFGDGLARRGRVPASGYTAPYAKGTIEMAGAWCYLGASDGGFQVRGTDGVFTAGLVASDFSAVRADQVMVNAASATRDLAFVAAGPLGVQVVDLGGYCDQEIATSAGGGDLRVLGELDFEENVSSNMVKAKNDILVVAAGLGGVKLVKMEF
jgi:hypothetical protein